MRKLFFAIIICLLTWPFAHGQIRNYSFEQWDDLRLGVYHNELVQAGVENPQSGIARGWSSFSGFGISKTTDAYDGESAAVIHTWFGSASDMLTLRDAVSRAYAYLRCRYKFVLNDHNETNLRDASATASALFFTRDGDDVDTIGYTQVRIEPAEEYTPLDIPIQLYSATMPDSMEIRFSVDYGFCRPAPICNFFYVDDISFSDQATTVAEDARFRSDVYPNPVSDILNIVMNGKGTARLLDLMGTALLSKDIETVGYMDVSGLPVGVYIMEVVYENGHPIHKRVVKL